MHGNSNISANSKPKSKTLQVVNQDLRWVIIAKPVKTKISCKCTFNYPSVDIFRLTIIRVTLLRVAILFLNICNLWLNIFRFRLKFSGYPNVGWPLSVLFFSGTPCTLTILRLTILRMTFLRSTVHWWSFLRSTFSDLFFLLWPYSWVTFFMVEFLRLPILFFLYIFSRFYTYSNL